MFGCVECVCGFCIEDGGTPVYFDRFILANDTDHDCACHCIESEQSAIQLSGLSSHVGDVDQRGGCVIITTVPYLYVSSPLELVIGGGLYSTIGCETTMSQLHSQTPNMSMSSSTSQTRHVRLSPGTINDLL